MQKRGKLETKNYNLKRAKNPWFNYDKLVSLFSFWLCPQYISKWIGIVCPPLLIGKTPWCQTISSDLMTIIRISVWKMTLEFLHYFNFNTNLSANCWLSKNVAILFHPVFGQWFNTPLGKRFQVQHPYLNSTCDNSYVPFSDTFNLL